MIRDPRGQAVGGYDLFRLSESDEEEAELVRLLYVATTRAADYLILSSGLPSLASARGPWTELLCRHFDPVTGQARKDPSGGVLVKVTMSEPPAGVKPAGPPARRNMDRLLEKARQMAAEGRGRAPKCLAAVPPDPAGWRQYSFSRLSGALHARPAVTQDVADEGNGENGDGAPSGGPRRLDPLGLGTLVHAVLADVDLSRPSDVAALVHRHAPKYLADGNGDSNGDNDTGQTLDEPIAWIERLLGSPRGADMAAAVEIHRELEFLLAWPPDRNDPAGPCLQGFIDCLYRDASGGWHVIDYKTNRVAAGELADVAAGYEMQMLVYGMAVERILGQAPKELTLCFLRPGLEYCFPWDDSARRKAVELVERAIERLCGRDG
jgi:ATP-dependent exoDNAse (exonuclease V) beta subunit